jgi:maltose alpha-D-glucosyltransferase/alpha-amylase
MRRAAGRDTGIAMNDVLTTAAPAVETAPAADDPLWYKDAIIYQLHIKAFFDANGDGIGDFAGLMAKLDYLKELGVSAVWVLPFYPSPLRDDGYDIADYRSINPSYGTMRDFRSFVRAAHARGLKVITELVINHTSDQHPWFQRARRAPKGSRHRDFYVWSDDDKKWPETRIIFTDTEPSNWTWDPVAQQFYWHRFFAHQPDLNFDNPAVVRSVIETMRYWLDMGVDGLRLDAIPYLVERDGTNNENLPETHAVLKALRAAMEESHPQAFFVAEANQWPEDTLPYFGEGDECQMAFHFPLMPRMYMAIAMEDRHPITDIMRQTPEIPARCQWAIFLRNHDELTLEMVTSRERDYMWQFYAADRRARINMGIRRRLAPLLENDRRRIELMNSLLFSMPGTPIVYYGDEIGMGDNVYLGDRNGVRTPMQWSPDRNGGFSRADPAGLYLPAIMDSVYGYEAVNVEAQHRSPSSLLNWMRRIIAVRQQRRAFGRGTLTFLYPGNRKALAYLREHEGETVLCVANLSRRAQAVELDLSRFKGRFPVELLGRSVFPTIGDLPYFLTLPAYGFYWFLLAEQATLPAWHEQIPDPLPDLVTLVVRQAWPDIVEGRPAELLTRDVLPSYIAPQRWFAGKGAGIARARLADAARLPSATGDFIAALVDVEPVGGPEPQRYFLPLGVTWDENAVVTASPLLPYALAKVRKGPLLGALHDAQADGGAFALAVVELMRGAGRVEAKAGALVFTQGSRLPSIGPIAPADVRRLGLEQSNSSTILGDAAVLKTYRRLQAGIHPEIEMGRFLTDVAGFANTPALLGSLEYVAPDGSRSALAVLQAFVRNQGDGWAYTLDYLQRELEDARLAGGAAGPRERFALYLQRAAMLGQRTAELHQALARATGDPAFDPEPMGPADETALRDGVAAQAEAAFAALERARRAIDGPAGAEVDRLLGRREECLALARRLAHLPPGIAKTRHHGDFHLGQVLVAQTDFVLVDFEGEPARGLDERRAKKSPLRDVAGMVRSFDYAAWAAVMHLAADQPALMETLLPHAVAWRDLATAAFLDAYRQGIEGSAGWPREAGAGRRLLDLLILEKALYEIAYEAAMRPAWLPIPVRGAMAILDAHAGAGT